MQPTQGQSNPYRPTTTDAAQPAKQPEKPAFPTSVKFWVKDAHGKEHVFINQNIQCMNDAVKVINGRLGFAATNGLNISYYKEPTKTITSPEQFHRIAKLDIPLFVIKELNAEQTAAIMLVATDALSFPSSVTFFVKKEMSNNSFGQDVFFKNRNIQTMVDLKREIRSGLAINENQDFDIYERGSNTHIGEIRQFHIIANNHVIKNTSLQLRLEFNESS